MKVRRFLQQWAWGVCGLSFLAASVVAKDPEATAIDKMKIAKDFRVERLYTVPAKEQGSWVNMCVDPKGRLIVSDQYGPLYRITPPALGASTAPVVEKIEADIGEAQGLVWAFDSLYAVVNSGGGDKRVSGLYRVWDSNGDDKLDAVEKLREFPGKTGEHGPHAVVLSPDKTSLYVVCGNQTKLTKFDTSRVPTTWGEDHLLPRMPDGRGFMKDVMGPGGAIYKTDPKGEKWELISVGYRNQYDAAFHWTGELFTYDADMEWDFNTPWYRPTRVCVATSGSEFGWRNGAGKWPAYYEDSLPAVVNVGPGSPTGVTFGYGAKFPAKYQDAFFICDWSYGKMYAVHLDSQGSGFTGKLEEFVTGTPLPLTDVVINPVDGAMYFTIGGRKVQSGLYRVTYAGSESTAASPKPTVLPQGLVARRNLEDLHTSMGSTAENDPVATAWGNLGSEDRYLRFAARVALEHQPVERWKQKALNETDPAKGIPALMALVHATGTCPSHRTTVPSNQTGNVITPLDTALKSQILSAITKFDFAKLNDWQKLALVRVNHIFFNRFGAPDSADQQKMIAYWDGHFPTTSKELNSELCQLLVYLQSPTVAVKTMKLMAAAPTQEEQIDYARALRMLKAGWTMDLRKEYFGWFLKAATYRGGMSFNLFVQNIFKDADANLTPQERAELQPILSAKPDPGKVVVAPPRPFVKEHKMEDLLPKIEAGLTGRNFDRGRQMFAAVNCFGCHRFDNQGGANGPDLTAVSGRFSPKDLLESVIDPSKVISDQYASVSVVLNNGRVVHGRIVNLAGETIKLNTNMLDPTAEEAIKSKDIDEIVPSKVSMMPVGLLNSLTEEEALDLMAYLLSRGDKSHPAFAPTAK